MRPRESLLAFVQDHDLNYSASPTFSELAFQELLQRDLALIGAAFAIRIGERHTKIPEDFGRQCSDEFLPSLQRIGFVDRVFGRSRAIRTNDHNPFHLLFGDAVLLLVSAPARSLTRTARPP